MKVFNLTQYASIKAENYINDHCGGRYTRKEAYNIGGIGIGRLRYTAGINEIEKIDTQERFRANTETFKKGLGIYVRSLSYNFLVIIPSNEIIRISLEKNADELKQTNFSWTQKLMNLGMPYHYARIMLLEQEIGETFKTTLEIETLNENLKFWVKRANPEKIVNYFEKGPYADVFSTRLNDYIFI